MLRILALLVFAMPAMAQLQQLIPGLRAKPATSKEPEAEKDDATILKDAGFAADNAAGLITYFKKRTLTNEQLAQIKSIIRRMGDESFEERQKASAEVSKFGEDGLGAIGPLRTAATTEDDPEIKFRALETLKSIEKVPQGVVASAAARALVKLKHPEATSVLLGFMPMADNPGVENDLRAALAKLAIQKGKFDEVLVKGLKDPNALRRAMAAVAMIEASVEGKTLSDEVARLVVPMLESETDADAKFRVAFELATRGRNLNAVVALVEVMPSLPRGRIWQVEDILLQLAGDKAPKIKLAAGKEALTKASGEWLAWIKDNANAADFAKINYKPRTNGCIIMLTVDQNWGGGRIVEYGPDLRQHWRILGITSPADFRLLPNGNVEVMEHNYSRVRELDLRGKQIKTQRFPGGPPMSSQMLENGNRLVAYRNSVVEYDDKWKAVHTWTRNNGDVLAAGRFGKGPTIVLVQNSPAKLIRLDEKFKELPNPVKLAAQPHYQAKIEVLANDRVLVTEQDKVAEYDLKDGKTIWKTPANQATCVQRLPSGSTIICDMGNRTIREISSDGKTLWTHTPMDQLQPLRAYRQ